MDHQPRTYHQARRQSSGNSKKIKSAVVQTERESSGQRPMLCFLEGEYTKLSPSPVAIVSIPAAVENRAEMLLFSQFAVNKATFDESKRRKTDRGKSIIFNNLQKRGAASSSLKSSLRILPALSPKLVPDGVPLISTKIFP